jgi:predicted GNAT family N-acyltransferase
MDVVDRLQLIQPVQAAPAVPDISPAKLEIRTLATPEEQQSIAHLRQYADFESEYELDPGLKAFERTKDALGIVMSIGFGEQSIATIRFIPTGHGVTLTERLWLGMITDKDILGPDSWEVGRLVMAPEYRRADLLPRCLALALQEISRRVCVRHFHASCLTRMTRLYRRFGFIPHGVTESRSGKQCALIHAKPEAVAAALGVEVAEVSLAALAE